MFGWFSKKDTNELLKEQKELEAEQVALTKKLESAERDLAVAEQRIGSSYIKGEWRGVANAKIHILVDKKNAVESQVRSIIRRLKKISRKIDKLGKAILALQ